MIRTVCFLLVSILISNVALAQYTSIRAKVGYGWYDMRSLKTLHQDAMSASTLPLRATSSFPPYFNTQLHFVNHSTNGRTAIGFVWDHVSTGGRLAYSDYSGELRSDQRLWAESVGVLLERQLPLTSQLSVVPGAQLLLTFTSFENEEYISITGQSSVSTIDFNALGVGFTPEIALRYQVGSWSLDADIGYYVSTTQGFYQTGNRDSKLSRTLDQSPIKPQWDGLRAGLTLGKSFGISENQPVIFNEESKDERIYYRGGLSSHFYVDNVPYRDIRHLHLLLKQRYDTQIDAYIREYRHSLILSTIFGTVGGVMVGWPVGTFLGGGKFNQSLFVTGMSLATVSLIMHEVAGSKARKIVRRYNASLR